MTLALEMKRINSLDGLRGISIGLVLLSHAGLGHIVPGGLGVTIFFFISGYIITRLLLREQSTTGSVDVAAFFMRRAFRILPALWVFLLACTAYLLWHFGRFEGGHLLSAVLNFYNYYYIFLLNHDSPVGVHHPYGIVWSLAVEEHYYLVYPFVCHALLTRRHTMVKWLLAVCVATFAWRTYLVFGIGLDLLPAERIYKATDTRIDSIVFGALFALLRRPPSQGRPNVPQSGWWSFAAGLLLLLLTLIARNEEFRQSLRYSVQGLALYLMFSKLVEQPGPLGTWLAAGPLVWLGKISYSLYLWHWLVMIALENSGAFGWPASIRNGLMLLLSLLAAKASFQLIEQPMLRKGQALLQRRAQSRLLTP